MVSRSIFEEKSSCQDFLHGRMVRRPIDPDKWISTVCLFCIKICDGLWGYVTTAFYPENFAIPNIS
jgi:hypothetical protein